MSFLQSCFVKFKSNQYDLEERLKELGYNQRIEDYLGSSEYTYVIAKSQGTFHFASSITLYTDDWGISCGDNEELFFAMAALRDNTDKDQWFIYDTSDCYIKSRRVITWIKCTQDKIEDELFYDCMYLNARKATVYELLKHFLLWTS